jgi:hypothetical protein
MLGNTVARKLHMFCIVNAALRPIAEFFKETYKLSVEAGV